jgi:hypothetical protein
MYIYEVQLVFIMDYDLVYGDFDSFFQLKKVHIEDIHIDVFNKIMSRPLVCNQQDNTNGHLINLCR